MCTSNYKEPICNEPADDHLQIRLQDSGRLDMASMEFTRLFSKLEKQMAE